MSDGKSLITSAQKSQWSFLPIGAVLATCLFSVVKVEAATMGTVSFNAPYSYSLSPGSEVVNVHQFDPAIHQNDTITSIVIFLTAQIQGNVTAENDSASAGNMGINLNGSATATAPSGLSTTTTVTRSFGPVPVGASDGVPNSGPDFFNFGNLSKIGVATSNSITSGFSPYIGSGDVFLTVNGSGAFSVTGVSPSTINTTNFGGSGMVEIQYHFVHVPEPSTIALGIAGAVCLLCLNRRRARR